MISNNKRLIHPRRLFQIFKYLVSILLAYNILLWFREDLAASAKTFGDTVTWRNVVEAYSATINAGTWLIIVVLLQAEVWLQLKDKLTDHLLRIDKISKGFFYSILFVCAAYWGIKGTFLDFWDAFLWLVAFIFIELNIFQWHTEG